MNKHCPIWKQTCVGDKCGVYGASMANCKLDRAIGNMIYHPQSLADAVPIVRFFESIRPVPITGERKEGK